MRSTIGPVVMMMLHKFNRRLLNGGLLAAIAVVGMTGCSGSGGDIPRRETVPLTGGASSVPATLDNAAPANPAGQTISINGGNTAFLAPTTSETPAGTTVVIVPEGTQFFSGLSRSATRSPGDVYVNGVNTGVSVDENGRLDGNIAVVNNQAYEVFVEGPLQISSGGRTLTINDGFGFNVVVRSNVASLPSDIDGTIPSNGGTAADMFLSVAYPAPFLDDSVSLTVNKSNGDVTQNRVLAPTTVDGETTGTTSFRDFVPSVVIPEEGVESIVVRFSEQ